MKKQSREENILELLNDSHDGYWDLKVHSKDGQDVRVARATLALHGLKDSRSTLTAYVSIFRQLLEAGTVEYRLGRFTGTWAIKVL